MLYGDRMQLLVRSAVGVVLVTTLMMETETASETLDCSFIFTRFFTREDLIDKRACDMCWSCSLHQFP
jgi:hypothetical protein